MSGEDMKIGCVVMAAGNARRFGDNKLARELAGKSLIRRAMEFGFLPVRNPHPDWGISHTIHLGLAALGECGAAMFLVSDQPLLRRETVKAEVDFFRRHPDKLVGLSHSGVRGNPCIFPAKYFAELRELREDHGGSTVIRRHKNELLLFETAAEELTDVDTEQALWGLRPHRD